MGSQITVSQQPVFSFPISLYRRRKRTPAGAGCGAPGKAERLTHGVPSQQALPESGGYPDMPGL